MKTASKKVAAELRRIAERNGGILRPLDVVTAARSPSSPLHSRFEWDNSKAAQEYRLEQARRLIRVVIHVLPHSERQERVWVSLRSDQDQKGGGYRPLVSVMSNAQMRGELLDEALRDASYFLEKYEQLEELSKVFAEMRKVIAKRKAV